MRLRLLGQVLSIFMASGEGHERVVDLLLLAGADRNMTDKRWEQHRSL